MQISRIIGQIFADARGRFLCLTHILFVVRERERVFICHKITKKTYKIILNISTVAGYQIGKPIKLVAIVLVILNVNIKCNRTKHKCRWVCKVQL